MTKKQAIAEANRLRSTGKTVKVYKETRQFTIPGRGFTGSSVEYTVRVLTDTDRRADMSDIDLEPYWPEE
jgi:hypothetical protein